MFCNSCNSRSVALSHWAADCANLRDLLHIWSGQMTAQVFLLVGVFWQMMKRSKFNSVPKMFSLQTNLSANSCRPAHYCSVFFWCSTSGEFTAYRQMFSCFILKRRFHFQATQLNLCALAYAKNAEQFNKLCRMWLTLFMLSELKFCFSFQTRRWIWCCRPRPETQPTLCSLTWWVSLNSFPKYPFDHPKRQTSLVFISLSPIFH